jgi:hypothetical protein
MNKPRDLTEWDAEIEVEFQRVVAATKSAGRSKRRRRLVGCPWGFLVDVCRSIDGKAALVEALHVYRRTRVCKSQTVTLPAAELAELGIGRSQKARALVALQAAGLIRIEGSSPGQTAKVTLLWKPH